ncbi:conserved hypothetical protein, partial [Ricinus communis]
MRGASAKPMRRRGRASPFPSSPAPMPAQAFACTESPHPLAAACTILRHRPAMISWRTGDEGETVVWNDRCRRHRGGAARGSAICGRPMRGDPGPGADPARLSARARQANGTPGMVATVFDKDGV